MERHEAEQQKKKADMLSVPFATLNQLLLYLLAPPFKNMMRSGRWVAYSWYINEDIIDINVFQASPLHMPRCRISFLSELRLARTGLQNMLLCWLHSILFKRRKLTFDALSQYQEFPPGSNSGTLVAVLFKVADRRLPLVLFWI
ncbi:uncharacterized protein [Lolium perenne]|uniref:uncharacterized protein isoform X2 n=1 Tax=Lolium perenne TaxID=4522 RepID=UPI003A9997E3